MSACASATGVSADARSGTSSTITTRARRASIAANSTAVVGPRQLDTLRRFADAPLGMGVVRSLAVIAIAGWLGIMAFVSFGVAPRIFRALDRAVAGEAVAAILPRYYDWGLVLCGVALAGCVFRSEEHTSELQSQSNLVCRLLLEKKKDYRQIQLHETVT